MALDVQNALLEAPQTREIQQKIQDLMDAKTPAGRCKKVGTAHYLAILAVQCITVGLTGRNTQVCSHLLTFHDVVLPVTDSFNHQCYPDMHRGRGNV